MELAMQGMALHLLLCLCLVGNIQLSSAEPPTLANDIQSPEPFTNKFGYTITDTASGENSTPNHDIRPSDTNIGSTNTHAARGGASTLINNTESPDSTTLNTTDTESGKIDTLNNEIESPVTDRTSDSTTLTEIFISTTTDIQSEKTSTFFTDLPDSTTITNIISSRTTHTASEETSTVISDTKSAGTETTAVTDNFILTTTDPATSECEATITISISEKYEELMNFTKQLDELFEETMTSCHDFIQTKNQTIGESTIKLATDYLRISKKFVYGVELQKTIIECQNNTASEKYEIDDIDEYEEKVEIVEILSDELGKMMGNETVHVQLQDDDGSEQNVTEQEIMTLFEELHSVVKLNKKVKDMETLATEQHQIYAKTQKVRDLDEVIQTLTEIIKIQNEIIQIINNSKSMKYLYDDEHSSKSSMIINHLVNTSNLEGQLNKYESYLSLEYAEHDIEEALFQLNEVIRPIVLGAIFLVGITVNGILLLVFVKHEDMRTGPNVMVINLNICDILGLTFNILFHIIESLSTDWTLGTAMCKLYRFCRYLTIGLSIYSLVAISVQRFIVLTEFFSLGVRCQFCGKFVPLINVLLVWVLASAVASPRAIKAYVNSLVCWSQSARDEEFFNNLLYVDFALYCALPFFIIFLTSGMSSLRLKSSVKHMPGEVIGQEKVIKARVLSSNIFLALIIVFGFCYMPYFLFSVYTNNVGIDAPFMTVKYVTFGLYCLIHSNATFNPIALYIASAKYRQYMKPYLCLTYIRNKVGSEASGSSNITIETRM